MRAIAWAALMLTACVAPSPTFQRPAPTSTLTLTLGDIGLYPRNTPVLVYGAAPNDRVHLVRSTGGFGSGACPPILGGACLAILADSDGYEPLGAAVADAQGIARWSIPNPAAAAYDWYFQAAILDGTDTRISNPVRRNLDEISCVDDAYEPNDYDRDAVPLSPGRIDGTACQGDSDWFEWDVPAGHVLAADLTLDEPDDVTLEIRLYSDANVRLDSAVISNSGGVTWANDTGQSETIRGSITTRLNGDDEGQAYHLVARSEPVLPCTDDALEDNDTPATAVPLQPMVSATVCDDDADWFHVDLLAGESLDARVTASGGEVEVVVVHATTGELLSTDGTAPYLAQTVSEVDQRVLVGVSSTADDAFGGGVQYTVEFERVVAGCSDDAWEDNDRQPDAIEMPPNVRHELRACDVDWFVFPVQEGDWISLDVEVVPGEGNFALNMLDELGDPLSVFDWTDHRVSVDGEIAVRMAPTSDGALGDGLPYTMEMDLVRPPACVEQGHEPDDTPSSATFIPAGETRAGLSCAGNVDHFAVDVTAGSSVQVAVRVEDVEGTVSVELLDPAGRVIGTGSSSRSYGRVWAYDVPAGRYIARVQQTFDGRSGGGVRYLVHDQSTRYACSDDALEPNDDQAGATRLPGSVSGSALLCPNTEDWFSFRAEPGDVIDVGVVAARLSTDVAIALYDPDGVRVGRDDVGVLELTHVAEDQGRYALQVELDTPFVSEPAVSYDVDLTLVSPSPCVQDAGEPDNTLGQAQPLLSGMATDARTCGDDDWFIVSAAAHDRLDLDLSYLEDDGRLRMRVLDPMGQLLDESLSEAHVEVPLTGTYAVQISMIWDQPIADGVDYTLNLQHLVAADCPADAFEHDDTASTATPVTGIHTAMACAGDEDWWSVDAAAGDWVSFAATASDNRALLRLSVFDPNGVELDTRSHPHPRATLYAEIAGTYTAQVTYAYAVSLPASGVSYDLTGSVSTPAACVEDGWEPNDTQRDAVLVPGTSVASTACMSNPDWFRIDATAGDVVRVDVDGPEHGERLRVNLVDEDGDVFAERMFVEEPTSISFTATETASYFVRVAMREDDPAGGGVDYTLDTQLTQRLACVDDGLEDNDGIPQATPLLDAVPLSAQSCAGDIDVFAVDLVPDQEVALSVDFDRLDGWIELYLYDHRGMELDHDATYPLEVSHRSVGAETAYAAVSFRDDDAAGGGVAYDIVATLGD